MLPWSYKVIRHITKDLGLTSEFTWKQLQAATDDFCKRDVGSLDPKERFQWLRCAAGNYIASLFKNLQFGPNHRINTPKRDTWTIGAVLYTLRIKIITSPISCYDGAGQRDLLENAWLVASWGRTAKGSHIQHPIWVDGQSAADLIDKRFVEHRNSKRELYRMWSNVVY